MKKRKWLTAAVFVAAVLLTAANAAAYLTDFDTASNGFSFGSNIIVSKEEFQPPEIGAVTSKTPRAKNTGTVDSYVRAYIALSDSRAGQYLEYRTGGNSGISGNGWELSETDGYYYYKDVLQPGDETEPLFTGIKLLTGLPAGLADTTIDVYFESVQAVGPGEDCAQNAFKKLQGK